MPNKVEGILWRRLTIKTRTLKTDEETHRKIRYVLHLFIEKSLLEIRLYDLQAFLVAFYGDYSFTSVHPSLIFIPFTSLPKL